MRALLSIAVLGITVAACVPPKAKLVSPPTVPWVAVDRPLASGVSAETFYLAAVQILAERGQGLSFSHDDARTLVSGWWPVTPPILLTIRTGSNYKAQTYVAKPDDDIISVTLGSLDVAFIVTVRAATARLDLACRVKTPIAPNVVPADFERCDLGQRPTEAVETAVEVLDATMARASELTPRSTAP